MDDEALKRRVVFAAERKARDNVLKDMVQGEVVLNSDSKSRNKYFLLFGIIVVVVAVAIAIGIGSTCNKRADVSWRIL